MAWQLVAREVMEAQRYWGGTWSAVWWPKLWAWIGPGDMLLVCFRWIALVAWTLTFLPLVMAAKMLLREKSRDEWRHWQFRRRRGRLWKVSGVVWLILGLWPQPLDPMVIPALTWVINVLLLIL